MVPKSAPSWLDRYLKRYLESQPSAGLSFALTDRQQTLHIGTYGYANLEAGTPVSPEHLFQIGSIGKSFTAIALLQLCEEGRLDLETPIGEILPWLVIPSGYEPIRIRHLLSHTAGIIQGTEASPTAIGEAWALRGSPASAPPGDYFHYSNSGYKLLGLVLETIEGVVYPEIIRRRIFEPLGMASTEAVIVDRIRPRQAVAYEPFPEERLHPIPFLDKSALSPAAWIETRTADGSIASTPADMACYLRVLLNRGKGLLRPEGFDRLVEARIKTADRTEEYYAFGLAVDRTGRRISHGGGMVGFRAELACDLGSGFGAIIMMNGVGEPQKAARAILEAAASFGIGEWPEILPKPEDPLQIEGADELAGVYQSKSRKLTLQLNGAGLRALEYAADLACREQGELQIVHPDFERYPVVAQKDGSDRVIGLAYGPEVFVLEGESLQGAVLPSNWRDYIGRYLSYNPWYRGFEVFERLGELIYFTPLDGEEPLIEVEPGKFRIGEDARSPEWLRFDTLGDGTGCQAVYSGSAYQRVDY